MRMFSHVACKRPCDTFPKISLASDSLTPTKQFGLSSHVHTYPTLAGYASAHTFLSEYRFAKAHKPHCGPRDIQATQANTPLLP